MGYLCHARPCTMSSKRHHPAAAVKVCRRCIIQSNKSIQMVTLPLIAQRLALSRPLTIALCGPNYPCFGGGTGGARLISLIRSDTSDRVMEPGEKPSEPYMLGMPMPPCTSTMAFPARRADAGSRTARRGGG